MFHILCLLPWGLLEGVKLASYHEATGKANVYAINQFWGSSINVTSYKKERLSFIIVTISAVRKYSSSLIRKVILSAHFFLFKNLSTLYKGNNEAWFSVREELCGFYVLRLLHEFTTKLLLLHSKASHSAWESCIWKKNHGGESAKGSFWHGFPMRLYH